MKCERCFKDADVFSCSWFNTQMICPSCQEEERNHPRYEEAKAKELEEVKKGNYNYEGIGWDR